MKFPFFPISPLAVPTTFNKAWTIEQQIAWLARYKQDKLIAGEGITLVYNGNGTYTISATGGVTPERPPVNMVSHDDAYEFEYDEETNTWYLENTSD